MAFAKLRCHLPHVLRRLAMLCRVAWLLMVGILVLVVMPGLLLPAIILCMVLAHRRRRAASLANSDTHGSASWSRVDELERAGALSPTSGVILGNMVMMEPPSLMRGLGALLTYPISRSAEAVTIASHRGATSRSIPVYLPSNQAHIAFFGSTGGGKTTCFALPYLLGQANESCVVLDPKGELANISAKHRHDVFGHEVVVIDPYGIARDCGFRSAGFNPFDLYRGNPSRVVDEARRMANALIVTHGHEPDPFWNAYASSVLTCIIAFLMAEANSDSSMNDMRHILSQPKLMSEMIELLLRSTSCSGLLARLAGQLLQAPEKTRHSGYTVAASHVEWLDSLPVAGCLARSTFNPRRLLTSRMTVYLVLPVDRIAELAGLQRVFLSSLINIAFEGGEKSSRCLRFVLDEAASLGRLPTLYNAVQFGRSFSIRLMLLFQSSSQIQRTFPESEAADVLASVASVYCATNDYRTAKDVSDYLGQQTIHSRSVQRGRSWGESQSHGGNDTSQSSNWGGNYSYTHNEVGRPLLRPEEILTLPRSLNIVLLPGIKPVMTRKTPYYLQRRSPSIITRWISAVFNLITVVVSFAVIPYVGFSLLNGDPNSFVVQSVEQIRHELTPKPTVIMEPHRGRRYR